MFMEKREGGRREREKGGETSDRKTTETPGLRVVWLLDLEFEPEHRRVSCFTSHLGFPHLSNGEVELRKRRRKKKERHVF